MKNLPAKESQLEIENLKNHVETLRDTIEDMKTHMYEIENKHNESSLDQKCEKHQKATESFINLQFEKSNLMEEVETLKEKIQDMGSLICETQKKQNEENELLSQEYRTFELEQEEIKRSLNRHIKFLMISKDKPALKYEEAQLEIENLINDVETLKDTVQDMKTQMYEIQNEHNQGQERIRKAQNILQLNLEETTKKLEQLSECERELVAYQNLTTEFSNSKVSLTDIKSLIKISLDQMWEEHHKATESFINLQFEKSSLMKDIKIMKGTVQDMGSLIYKTQKKQDEEYMQMVQDYSTLHLEQEEIKKSINEGNMLLKKMRNLFHSVQNCVSELPLRPLLYAGGTGAATVIIYYLMRKTVKEAEADQDEESASEDSGLLSEVPQDQAMISKDEAVLKYQEAQLEIENLKNHVDTLKDTVQDMKTHMYKIKIKQNQEQESEQKAHKALQLEHVETMKKLQHCKELLSECERERVAHQNLTVKYNNARVSLTDIKAAIKSSSDQVWEKHQKAMESFINLQFENSNLMKDVGILKSRIQDMKSLIYETQKEQEEEYTRVIQDYNTLHLEQEQIKRSLNQSKLELKKFIPDRLRPWLPMTATGIVSLQGLVEIGLLLGKGGEGEEEDVYRDSRKRDLGWYFECV
ncbi:hypothetical protein C0J50_17975 [Silurus asotus]|uniref:Uncharacterized protein n=1 Tax=Silurus asotus TaxID=30991 RepID=A0AAD5AVH7_SILAS|nr:hypothetical protein C0J50_17975 [Silurus asotus]